jgi:hypothetical protein
MLIFVFEAFIPCFSWPFRANYRTDRPLALGFQSVTVGPCKPVFSEKVFSDRPDLAPTARRSRLFQNKKNVQ